VQHVSDPGDPRLDPYRRLTDSASRVRADADAGIVVVEGVLALERAVEAGLGLRSVVVTPGRALGLRTLLDRLPPSVERLVAERDVLAAACGYDVHRGVLAVADRPAPREPDAVLRAARRVVVAEAIGDQENLGSLFRCAAALGVDAVLLDARCADPWSRRVVRVSLGWATAVPHACLGALPDGLDLLGDRGFRTVACTPRDATPVDRAAADGVLDDPLALLVGAEGPGLTPAAIARADARVAVPMADGVDSLNVATALAVVAAFAAARRGWER
jgi:tRNA G18 (ribose-2'-O)-methylase SpoU